MLLSVESILSGHGGKKVKVVAGVMLAANWTGTEAPFEQEVQVDEVKAVQDGILCSSQEATMEQREAAREGLIDVKSQRDGYITLVSDNYEPPQVDIPFTIFILN